MPFSKMLGCKITKEIFISFKVRKIKIPGAVHVDDLSKPIVQGDMDLHMKKTIGPKSLSLLYC